MEIILVPAIVVICYIFAELLKLTFLKRKSRYKYIPALVGLFGGVLGCVIYYISPELLCHVDSPFTAAAIGIISGLAATGGNQVLKQLLRKEN